MKAKFILFPSPVAPAKERVVERRGKYGMAGGSILAFGIIAGLIAGVIYGQPSLGILGGTAAGALLALLFWLVERRR